MSGCLRSSNSAKALSLPVDQRTSLGSDGEPGNFGRLSVDAVVGEAYWDLESSFSIEIGPVGYAHLGPALAKATILTIPHPANEYMDVALPVKLLDSMAAADRATGGGRAFLQPHRGLQSGWPGCGDGGG